MGKIYAIENIIKRHSVQLEAGLHSIKGGYKALKDIVLYLNTKSNDFKKIASYIDGFSYCFGQKV